MSQFAELIAYSGTETNCAVPVGIRDPNQTRWIRPAWNIRLTRCFRRVGSFAARKSGLHDFFFFFPLHSFVPFIIGHARTLKHEFIPP